MQSKGKFIEPEKAEPRFRCHKGDYKKMSQNLLQIDWETNLNALTTEDAWKFLSSMLNDQMKKYIPKSAPSKDKRRKIWMTGKAIAEHNKKQQVWKRYPCNY